jgi:hypothetical protein
VDNPGNFIDVGWKDPSIIKFAPEKLREHRLHVKEKDGFRFSPFRVCDMPGVFLYRRNATFNHKTFLTEESVNWGTTGGEKDSLGIKGSRSVMLAAMRLVYYLGFRTVYLLGCDFKMEKRKYGNYAWRQDRSNSSIKGNNRTYEVLNERFKALLPLFKEGGLEVFNCNPDSGLEVFPHMEYEKALTLAGQECAVPVDTDGWYSHGKEMKKHK